ncbi:hypothetical protein [Clostridium sp. BL-8]|uniref:hypothetical protein n=1 Tax=Clostridium sp. BL-8 TaxID=349938 RepID=UPI00098CE1D8|nr:hypothetical protein [Clostridium sp. BL-8]OOM78937.1 hypothetical protein CLOBL_19270 [Clostridium sp. BL-8]
MESKKTLETIEMDLSSIEKRVNEIITLSLKAIKEDPSLEKEILNAFMTTSSRISNYFFRETENTNTEHVGKAIVKYAMFKKF